MDDFDTSAIDTGDSDPAVLEREWEEYMREQEQQGAAAATAVGEEKRDFYSILNVTRQVTEEDLKASYRRLCMMFHPDKHVDPEKKAIAQKKFREINEAYDVLVDENKRNLYDMFGYEAISKFGGKMEVGALLKTPEQFRNEFLRLKEQERKSATIAQVLRGKSSVTMQLSVAHLFTKNTLRDLSKIKWNQAWLVLPRLVGMNMSGSLQTPIGGTSSVSTFGFVQNQGWKGGSILGTSMKYAITPSTTADMVTVIGRQSVTKAGVTHRFSAMTVAETELVFPHNAPFFPYYPGYHFTLRRQLQSNLVGSLTYRVQPGPTQTSSLAVGYQHHGKYFDHEMKVEAGADVSSIETRIKKPMKRNAVNVGFRLSTDLDLSLSFGGEHKFSPLTKVGARVELSSSGGISLVLSGNRMNQGIEIPILISKVLDLNFAIYAAALPICIGAIIKFAVFDPRSRSKKRSTLDALRRANRDLIIAARKEAEDAIKVMLDVVSRKVESEEGRNGLIIYEAVYGNFDVGGREIDPDLPVVIDVTVPVMSLVHNSKLFINGTFSKASLAGFYDPCFKEAKKLQITYCFQGALHRVVIDDNEPLAAPNKSHIIAGAPLPTNPWPAIVARYNAKNDEPSTPATGR